MRFSASRPLSRTLRTRRTLALGAAALMAFGLAAPAAGTAAPGRHRADTGGWQRLAPRLPTPWSDDVSPSNALPEYPRPQLRRDDWRSLNGVWQFAGASAGDEPPVGKQLDERILVPYPTESALSGIERHDDYMWYRREVQVPKSWHVGRDQHLRLNFGAVDYRTTVYVNGEQVAEHTGGYDKFSVDVTDALRRSGPQEVIVGVEDRGDDTWQPLGKQRNVPDRGIFYTGASGIWQSVWMEPVPTGYVDSLQTTPDIDTDTLTLDVDTAGRDNGLTAVAQVRRGHKRVATASGPADAPLEVKVPHARLWSPDHPFLYDLRVTLKDDRKKVDRVDSYFGMREIGTARGADGKLRITLNHKITFLMSTLDQGYWPDGIYTAPTDDALAFDLREHKRLGFNTVRKHIKVEPDRWYYWADRLGLMVWQDMPAMKVDFGKSRAENTPPPAAQQEFERELHEMVREHDSWTSIIGWVPFNEGWGEWNREATGRIADDVAAQDPSRLVNAHSGVNCCNSLGDSGKGDVIDHHQYVGPATPTPTEDRVAIDGEHGGFGLEVPGHMWYADGGAYEMEPDSATLTRRYVENQNDLLRAANACGISGGIYTQITDVEHEVNGFFTYDRAEEKMDFDQVRDVNRKIIEQADGSGSGVSYPPGTPGLTGSHFWPADEGSGTVAADQVADSDLSLRNGATWAAGESGSGLQLDGNGQYADTSGPVVDTSGNFTVAAWVKLDSTGGWQTAVGQDAPAMSSFFLQKTGDSNRFAFSTSGGRALSTMTPVVGRWYHLVGVRDAAAGSHSLYVDGQLQGSFDQCLNDGGTPGAFSVGRARFNSGNVDFWHGGIDQVHVWDRALGPDEVAGLYASGH